MTGVINVQCVRQTPSKLVRLFARKRCRCVEWWTMKHQKIQLRACNTPYIGIKIPKFFKCLEVDPGSIRITIKISGKTARWYMLEDTDNHWVVLEKKFNSAFRCYDVNILLFCFRGWRGHSIKECGSPTFEAVPCGLLFDHLLV